MNSIYIVIFIILVAVYIYIRRDQKEHFEVDRPCFGNISSKTRLGDDYFFTNYMLDTNKTRKDQIVEQKTQDQTTVGMLQKFKDTVLQSNDSYQDNLRQYNNLNQNIDSAFKAMNSEVNKSISEAHAKKTDSLSLLQKIGEKVGTSIASSSENTLTDRLKPVVKGSLENQLSAYQQSILDNNNTPMTAMVNRVSDKENAIYDWQYLPQLGFSAPVRVDPVSGEVQCLSFDGSNCDGDWIGKNGTDFSKIDSATVKPLNCGNQHQKVHGTDGYSNPDHWCRKAYDYFADQSTGNNDYSMCPKGWNLIDQDKEICQAPANYSRCPSVPEVRKMYPDQCGKNSCGYFNQPNQTYTSSAKRDWAKSCGATYPFKVNVPAINKGLSKTGTKVADIIRNRLGQPGQTSNLDRFNINKSGVLVRAYRLNNNRGKGDLILEKLITSTINFNWGTGTLLGIQPNGADKIFLEFSGYIQAPKNANSIIFRMASDDGSRLSLAPNGDKNTLTQIINQWDGADLNQPKSSGQINVSGGTFMPFILEYYEDWGGAAIRLEWSINNGTFVVVPREAFFLDNSLCANQFEVGFAVIPKFDRGNLMVWNIDEQLTTSGLANQINEQIVNASQIVLANIAIGKLVALNFISGVGGTSNGKKLVIERKDQNSGFASLRDADFNRNYGTISINIPSQYISNPPKISIDNVAFYLLPPNVFNNGQVSPLQTIA